jgi:hypothetical protein
MVLGSSARGAETFRAVLRKSTLRLTAPMRAGSSKRLLNGQRPQLPLILRVVGLKTFLVAPARA